LPKATFCLSASIGLPKPFLFCLNSFYRLSLLLQTQAPPRQFNFAEAVYRVNSPFR